MQSHLSATRLTPFPPSHAHHSLSTKAPYDSVEILAFGFVTLTPSSFARETISIRFLAETACAILAQEVSIGRRYAVENALTLRRRSCCA